MKTFTSPVREPVGRRGHRHGDAVRGGTARADLQFEEKLRPARRNKPEAAALTCHSQGINAFFNVLHRSLAPRAILQIRVGQLLCLDSHSQGPKAAGKQEVEGDLHYCHCGALRMLGLVDSPARAGAGRAANTRVRIRHTLPAKLPQVSLGASICSNNTRIFGASHWQALESRCW